MGPCGVITAFNFPVAVWAWNTALALVCGNPVIWMLSEKTPLSALVTMKMMERALARFGNAPDGLIQLVIGDPRADGILIGPLIDQGTSDRMQAMLESAKAEGGTVHGGGVAQGIEVPVAEERITVIHQLVDRTDEGPRIYGAMSPAGTFVREEAESEEEFRRRVATETNAYLGVTE